MKLKLVLNWNGVCPKCNSTDVGSKIFGSGIYVDYCNNCGYGYKG